MRIGASEPPTVHPLKKDQGYFWTGISEEGKQVIVTNTVTEVLVLRFDSDGSFCGKQLFPLSKPATPLLVDGVFATDAEFFRSAEADIAQVAETLQFRAGDIRIHEFSDDETHCGLEVVTGGTPEDHASEWRGDGKFLLWLYGIDYWISGSGEVQSHG